jgi:CheY-like chemotaxis protein
LEALAGARFDLVLTDALADLSPAAGPWATLDRIRVAAGGTPVVICTAHDPELFAGFAARGFGGLVRKPFSLAELLAAVAAVRSDAGTGKAPSSRA